MVWQDGFRLLRGVGPILSASVGDIRACVGSIVCSREGSNVDSDEDSIEGSNVSSSEG